MKASLYVAFISVFVGCATTNMATFKNPSHNTPHEYHKVVVTAVGVDQLMAQKVENIFQRVLGETFNTAFLPSQQIFSPTKIYDERETLEILEKERIDGVLLISLTDQRKNRFYVPGNSHISGTVQPDYAGGAQVDATVSNGGYTVTKLEQSHEIQLVDTKSFDTVWLGSSNTKGNAWAGSNNLLESVASETCEKLIEDQMMKTAKSWFSRCL